MCPSDTRELSELWNTPFVQKRKTFGFWWWFFFLVFKNPPEKFPRQFMTLWATKDVRQTIVNDRLHQHTIGITRTQAKDTFKGVLSSWYFDGQQMHQDLILENALCTNQRTPSPGIFVNGKSRLSLVPQGSKIALNVDSDVIQVNMQWEPNLAIPYLGPTGQRKSFLKGLLQQDIFRINQFKFSGDLAFEGRQEQVDGIGYLQRIVVNTPVPPWWWGVLFFENGSMTKYFLPHIGPSIFRRSIRDHPSPLEIAFKPISRSMEFYDAEKNQIYRFQKARIRKYFKPDGLPIFHVKYLRQDGSLEYYLNCYSRTYFKLKNKVFGWQF